MTRIIKKKLTLFLLAVVAVYLILAILPRPDNYEGDNPFIQTDLPLIIAHGGGNHEFPDNTLEAYYNAYSIDPNVMLETDVNITNDDVIILSHDTTLDRKTSLKNADIHTINYTYLIENKINFGFENTIVPESNGYNETGNLVPYETHLGETVTPLDVSYPNGVVPRDDTVFLATTLEELIKAFPNNKINVEIKQSGDIGLEALEAVITLMTELNASHDTFDRMVLASFHDEVYNALLDYKEAYPLLKLSPSRDGVQSFFIFQRLRLSFFFRDPIAVLQVPPQEGRYNLLTQNFITTAKRHNIALHYWTINDEAMMRTLIDMGVDGIMTDRPTVLKAVLEDYES
jgi:glycerophosphoryl diester phosphodiesterase